MTKPASDLTGMWFLSDSGETYITGRFIRRLSEEAYLVQPDDMNASGQPVVPMRIYDLCDLVGTLPCGNKQFRIFATRADLDKWLAWIEMPSTAKVIRIVKETTK